jgi:hypothetical protein
VARILEYFAEMTSAALESLTPEECYRVNGMLGLRVMITLDGTLDGGGTLGEGR